MIWPRLEGGARIFLLPTGHAVLCLSDSLAAWGTLLSLRSGVMCFYWGLEGTRGVPGARRPGERKLLGDPQAEQCAGPWAWRVGRREQLLGRARQALPDQRFSSGMCSWGLQHV